MIRKFLFYLHLILFFPYCMADQSGVLLPFFSGPVSLKSDVSLSIQQSLPGFSLSTKGNQLLNAELILHPPVDAGSPIMRPPFDLTFILKSLKITLKANNEDLVFDSEKTLLSPYQNQVQKIIDQPLELHFGGDHFQFEMDKLSEVFKAFPLLQEVKPEAVLMDVFLHLFALGGENLTLGKVIERKFEGLNIPSLPDKILYTITQIDSSFVEAKIRGNIDKTAFSLAGKVKVNDEDLDIVKVSLSGLLEGKGKWRRDNAMLYDLKLRYNYTARFQLAKWEWMMHITCDLHNYTHPKEK